MMQITSANSASQKSSTKSLVRTAKMVAGVKQDPFGIVGITLVTSPLTQINKIFIKPSFDGFFVPYEIH